MIPYVPAFSRFVRKEFGMAEEKAKKLHYAVTDVMRRAYRDAGSPRIIGGTREPRIFIPGFYYQVYEIQVTFGSDPPPFYGTRNYDLFDGLHILCALEDGEGGNAYRLFTLLLKAEEVFTYEGGELVQEN